MEWKICSLIEVLPMKFSRRGWRKLPKTSIRISVVPADIRTQHIQVTSQERDPYTNPFGCWVTILSLAAASRQPCQKSDRAGHDALTYRNVDRNHRAALNYWIFFCPLPFRPYPSMLCPSPITNRNKNPIKLVMDAAGGERIRI